MDFQQRYLEQSSWQLLPISATKGNCFYLHWAQWHSERLPTQYSQIISNRLQNCPSGGKTRALLLSTDRVPLWSRSNSSQLDTNHHSLRRPKANSVATSSLEYNSLSKFQLRSWTKEKLNIWETFLACYPQGMKIFTAWDCAVLCLSTRYQKVNIPAARNKKELYNWAHPEVSLQSPPKVSGARFEPCLVDSGLTPHLVPCSSHDWTSLLVWNHLHRA